MSREIKFRVWNGAEMVHDVTVGKFGVFYVNPTNNGLDLRDSASITPFTTKYNDGTPLMQYTGLTDKHGFEIYEGDIINSKFSDGKDCSHVVEWDESGFVVRFYESQTDAGSSFSQHWLTEFEKEVIGNIYANPELIKQ